VWYRSRLKSWAGRSKNFILSLIEEAPLEEKTDGRKQTNPNQKINNQLLKFITGKPLWINIVFMSCTVSNCIAFVSCVLESDHPSW
jgi:hypothetical protein